MLPALAAALLIVAGGAFAIRYVVPKQQVTAAAQKREAPAAARGGMPSMRVGEVTAGFEGFRSWALLDRGSGRITGASNMAEPSDTMSMVKAWLAADYLRVLTEKGEEPSD